MKQEAQHHILAHVFFYTASTYTRIAFILKQCVFRRLREKRGANASLISQLAGWFLWGITRLLRTGLLAPVG